MPFHLSFVAFFRPHVSGFFGADVCSLDVHSILGIKSKDDLLIFFNLVSTIEGLIKLCKVPLTQQHKVLRNQ